MIQFAAAGAGVLKELVGLVGDILEDPDTYKKVEGLRQFLCKITGKEIDQNGLVALLELSTQGEPYTGKWEVIDNDSCRLRVAGGYLYSVNETRPVFVSD